MFGWHATSHIAKVGSYPVAGFEPFFKTYMVESIELQKPETDVMFEAANHLSGSVSLSPAKKQSQWSAKEDALIVDLRGGGMKWENISKRLSGRSAISCRLHYQNYLERRSEW
jgi:hypothetical protein